MIQFNREQFRDILNSDGEFSVASEYWETDLHLGLGVVKSRLKIRDGKVIEIREAKEIETDIKEGQSAEAKNVHWKFNRPFLNSSDS